MELTQSKEHVSNQVFELRLVAEKYKEVANRELKTAVEQVQCADDNYIINALIEYCS